MTRTTKMCDSGLEDVFREGDILFGIPTLKTVEIISAFSKKFPNHYCTIDPYIHTFIGFVNSNLLGMQKIYRYGECPEILNKANTPHVLAFRKYFESHLKYNPNYVYNNNAPVNSSQYSLRVKRACKAWIEWTVRAENPMGRIHVLLDDVNLERIFSPAQDDVFFRSELKMLFKTSLSDPEKFQERIFFWKDGKQVNAPWQGQSSWNDYQVHLQTKRDSNHALSSEEQQTVKQKIYANNPSGEVTCELLSKRGLFSAKENAFVKSRGALEKREHQYTHFSVPRIAKL